MIKRTFLVLFACVSIYAYAQEDVKEKKPKRERKEKPAKEKKADSEDGEESSDSFKPQSGEISIDFTANNLLEMFGGGEDLFKLSDEAEGFGGGIRFRYFISPNQAVRVNFITDQSYYSGFPLISDPLGSNNETDELNEKDGMSGFLEQNYSHYRISLGFEKHMEGTKRLDTYIGCEAVFDYVSMTESYRNITQYRTYKEGYVAKVEGGSLGEEYITFDNAKDLKAAPGMGVGLRLCVGADYYILKKIYLGAELGAGAINKWVADYQLKEITPENSSEVIKTISDRGQSFNVTQDITAQFRLGFRL